MNVARFQVHGRVHTCTAVNLRGCAKNPAASGGYRNASMFSGAFGSSLPPGTRRKTSTGGCASNPELGALGDSAQVSFARHVPDCVSAGWNIQGSSLRPQHGFGVGRFISKTSIDISMLWCRRRVLQGRVDRVLENPRESVGEYLQ